MRRRDFIQAAGAAALLTSARGRAATVHNFDGYDFGPGPPVAQRLYQGPFPPTQFAGWQVVMATTASTEVIRGFGMGMVTYLCDEVGPPASPARAWRNHWRIWRGLPLGTKLYLRVNWKDVQRRPGRLDLCEHWQLAFDLAKRYDKRLGLRVMMSNPDIEGTALPEFLAQRVPMVELGEWQNRRRFEPRYDDPRFQAAFNELTGCWRDEYDGHPQVEYVDTAMYGFWGEGHTWPLERNPFPDYATAEATFVRMLEQQLEHWKKTPLATNTQPDFSKVGNFELRRAHRAQPQLAAHRHDLHRERADRGVEQPSRMDRRDRGSAECRTARRRACISSEGVTLTDNVIGHVRDVGRLLLLALELASHPRRRDCEDTTSNIPDALNGLARSIGYRVRPSWIWTYDSGDEAGLILGMVNDGIAGVPGVLRISILDESGRVLATGSLDAGYPLPGKVRQAKFPAARHGLERIAREGRDRSERPALSGALGMQTSAQRRWQF